MKSRVVSRRRTVGKMILTLMTSQMFVWNFTGLPIGASTADPLAGAITQANLTKLINASISVKRLPSSPKPSLNLLAGKGDGGNTDLSQTSCGYIEVSQWRENIDHCYFGDTASSTTVALVGDSRASMYLNTFASLGKLEHFKVLFIAKDGCPSPLGNYSTNNDGKLSPEVWTTCNKFHSYEISNLGKIKPKVIVISSNTEIDLTDPVHVASPHEIQVDLTAFLSKLPTTSRVVVLGGFPQPAPASNPTVCISRRPSNVTSCAFTPIAVTRADNGAFASAAASTGAAFVNQTPWFCTSTCPAVIGRYIPYTVDAYHSNNTYLNFLKGVLWSSIGRYVK
jgi:SGNH domain (fused to AT3 domains)